MQPVFIFGVLTAATVAVSLKRTDSRLAALALAVLSFASTVGPYTLLPQDTVLTFNLVCDFIAAVAFVIAWRIIWPPRNWLFALALTFLAQVMAHYSYHPALGAAYRLQVTLNVLYVLQLLTVVIGPRMGQIIGHARDVFGGPVDVRHRRAGRRGVVATADDIICKVGARALREKSR